MQNFDLQDVHHGKILCSILVCVFCCTCFHVVFFGPVSTAMHIAVLHVVCSLVNQSWWNVLNISITPSDSIHIMHIYNVVHLNILHIYYTTVSLKALVREITELFIYHRNKCIHIWFLYEILTICYSRCCQSLSN